MDAAGFEFLNSLAAQNPTLGSLAIVLAKYGVFFYPVLLVWLWASSTDDRHRGILLLAVAACAFALGTNAGLNIITPRPRPFLTLPATVLVTPPHDPSFPSDHAAIASAVSANLLLSGEPEWGALALLLAFVIGAARVAVGVHYPSDIIGGLMVGTAFGFVFLAFYASLRPVLDAVIRIARRLRLA
jgi:undecaprenyl-diphosphatase